VLGGQPNNHNSTKVQTIHLITSSLITNLLALLFEKINITFSTKCPKKVNQKTPNVCLIRTCFDLFIANLTLLKIGLFYLKGLQYRLEGRWDDGTRNTNAAFVLVIENKMIVNAPSQ